MRLQTVQIGVMVGGAKFRGNRNVAVWIKIAKIGHNLFES